MDSSLIGRIVTDHEMIRSLYAELRRECDGPLPDEDHCLEMFRHLKAFAVAHAKAEEFVLYAMIEEPELEVAQELQHFAFEGYEEHDLIDFLLKEMGQAEELSHQWHAQLVVLGEMFDHHFVKEERELFPKVRMIFNEQDQGELGLTYANERDALFARKFGQRPVLAMAPTLSH